jgi:CheY-like chemotaxis protein
VDARILVVDDCEVLLTAIEEILAAAGYAVATAADGRQALEALPRVSPQLIVSDIQMPSMDGIALCHTLRTFERWATVPLIFMSGREYKNCCEPTGPVAFLPKPFSPENLLALVTQFV